MEKLTKKIEMYLFLQNILGVFLSVLVLLILLFQSRSWELWLVVYTLIPTAGCTLIHLVARFTLKYTFSITVPPLGANQKRILLIAAIALALLELLLFLMR